MTWCFARAESPSVTPVPTVLPQVVVKDERRGETLVTVGESTQLREQFDAITTPKRRMERLERPPAFPVAQGGRSVAARYGSREPRTCEDKKAPALGPITAPLAQKYLNCQMEYVAGGGDLYLVENLKVEVGGGVPYSAIMRQRTLNEVDVTQPVYPLRGSLLRYQCQDRVTAARVATANCNTSHEPNATGYCYRTTFGDWSCYMNDPAASDPANVRHDVPPPGAVTTPAANPPALSPPDRNTQRPSAPKDNKPTTGAKAGVERDENGLVKPDFSELEQFLEVVRFEYNPIDGRFTMVVKARKPTNIFKWSLVAYDADGVKISETSLNGNVVTPEIGEPTRIYSFAPNEKDIRRVTRIAFVRKPD